MSSCSSATVWFQYAFFSSCEISISINRNELLLVESSTAQQKKMIALVLFVTTSAPLKWKVSFFFVFFLRRLRHAFSWPPTKPTRRRYNFSEFLSFIIFKSQVNVSVVTQKMCHFCLCFIGCGVLCFYCAVPAHGINKIDGAIIQ